MRSRGYIFLLSHMRSYSSLLAHILGSHPEIDGYSELHQHYHDRSNLRNMTALIERTTGEPRRGRYALDKLLHDAAEIDPAVLARRDVHVLFFVRRPEPTIESIVRLARSQDIELEVKDPFHAANYYVHRMRGLEALSAQVGERGRFVEAERVVDETDAVLAGLTAWLGLATPLRPDYRRFMLTGVIGKGDASPNIFAGRVLGNGDRLDAPGEPIEVPAASAKAAREAYERTVASLRARLPGLTKA